MTEQLSEADIFASVPANPIHGRGVEPPEPDDAPEPREAAEEQRPEPNLGQLPDGRGEQQESQPQEPPKRSMLDDLKEERKRRQDFERQLAERDRQMAEYNGRMRAMEEMFQRMQARPQQPEQPKAPVAVPDPFADPDAFARFQAEQVLQQRLTPIEQQFQQFQQRQQAVVQDMQRQLVATQYGADVQREAEEAFNTAAARNAIDPNEWRRIQSSPNPYAAAVEWHRRNKTLETVGHDPEKWFGSEFERRLSQDPAFKQQVYDMLTGQAQQGQAAGGSAPAAGKPPPVFTGLPSLNSAPGSSGRDPVPLTEADIFNSVPSKVGVRRR